MVCGHEATSFQGCGAVRPKGFDLARLRGYELFTHTTCGVASHLSNVVASDAPHDTLPSRRGLAALEAFKVA